MAIFRGAGGPGDATTDAANEASVASTKAAEAEASATAAASSAISASNSATTAINSKDAAATSESNAATSALAASTSEANASTSASAADTSATAAQTAQTAAEAAKTAAETAETGAEVAKTGAETAQTAAELAQTEAETAETNAETAQAAAESALASTLSTLDEFDDIYLGAKASPPNTDNDGNTLQTGAIYWDTGDNQLYIWDGANWDAAAFNVTGAVTSFNTRTGAVTLQNNDVTTAVGQSLQVGDSPTFAGLTTTGNIAVTGTVDGRDIATDGTKLDGIEASATADQTGAEIKAAYELEANAFTDAQFTKLAGIETSADVTDTTNVTAAGAVMDSELTSEASVKALDQGVATTDSPSFAGLTVDTNTLYVDSTNNRVGIGTSSPSSLLHLSTSDPRIRITDTDTAGTFELRNTSNVAYINTLANAPMIFGTNSTERMRITSGGNVGIGTTVPTAPLTVAGNIATDKQTISSWGATNTRALELTTYGAASSNDNVGTVSLSCNAYESADNSWNRVAGTSASLYQAKYTGDHIWYSTGAGVADSAITWSERMRINSAGNVGIGTSSPSQLLTVAASGSAARISITDTDTVASTMTGVIEFDGSDTRAGFIGYSSGNLYLWTDGADNVIFGTDASERMRIDTSGNVGIGTTSPAVDLDIENSDTAIIQLKDTGDTRSGAIKVRNGDLTFVNGIGVSGAGTERAKIVLSDNSFMSFDTGATERMRITSSGNVGIGTTSTLGAKLFVAQGAAASPSTSGNMTTGTVVGSGTAGEALNVGTDADGVWYNAAYGNNAGVARIHRWLTGGVERMRINSSGNVGIGTSSPSYKLEVKGAAATAGQLSIHDGAGDTVTSGNNAGSLLFQARDSSIRTIAEIDAIHTTTNGTGGAMVFQTRVSDTLAERMRIDSSGNLLVGTTAIIGGILGVGQFKNVNAGAAGIVVGNSGGTSATNTILFVNSNGIVGGISTNGSSTAYNTSSDYRLKENWQPMSGSVDRVKALNPVNFAWKADGSRVDGFLAHEAQTVVPEAVTGTHNEVDDDGNPVMQGIDQSKLVPLLTAALQEAITKIEALEARVATLESN